MMNARGEKKHLSVGKGSHSKPHCISPPGQPSLPGPFIAGTKADGGSPQPTAGLCLRPDLSDKGFILYAGVVLPVVRLP